MAVNIVGIMVLVITYYGRLESAEAAARPSSRAVLRETRAHDSWGVRFAGGFRV